MQPEKVLTVTALTKQEKKPWRTSIFIDGKFWRGFETETIVELGLYEGQRLAQSELEELDHSLDKRRALNRAVLLLSYRSRSEHEISDRLSKAGFASNTIAEVIDDLKRLDYLNDDAFSKSWMKSRMDSKLYGSRRIKQELKLKGVPDEIIERQLEENTAPEDEYNRAKTLAETKLSSSSYKSLEKDTLFRRLSQFLLRRGYSSSTVYDLCKDVIREHFGD